MRTGRVYCIHPKEDSGLDIGGGKNCYVGSCFQTLERRWSQHKCDATKRCPGKSPYRTILELGGIEKFEITLMDEREVASKEDLRQLEETYRRVLEPTLNARQAKTTHAERRSGQYAWQRTNRAHQAQQRYLNANRDRINARRRERRAEKRAAAQAAMTSS